MPWVACGAAAPRTGIRLPPVTPACGMQGGPVFSTTSKGSCCQPGAHQNESGTSGTHKLTSSLADGRCLLIKDFPVQYLHRDVL